MKKAMIYSVLAIGMSVSTLAFAQDADQAPYGGQRGAMQQRYMDDSAAQGKGKSMQRRMPKMMRADTNKDGVISKSEMLEQATRRFELMDTNKDGEVSKDEMKAHHQKMRANFKGKGRGSRGNDGNFNRGGGQGNGKGQGGWGRNADAQ